MTNRSKGQLEELSRIGGGGVLMLKGWEYQSFASIFLRSQKKDFINTESAGNCQCLEYGRQRRDLIHVFKNNDFYFSF